MTTLKTLLCAVLLCGAVLLALAALRRGHAALRARFTERARDALEDLFLFVDPSRVFRLNLVLLIGLPLLAGWATRAWPAVLLAALGAALLPRMVLHGLRTRRQQRVAGQLPDALAMLAGSLRAGASLQVALSTLVHESPAGDPLAQELSLVLRGQRLGMTLDEALASLSRRLALDDIDLFVTALAMAREVGGNLAEVLDRLAAALRTQSALEGKLRALTAQGKLQGWVVGLLPLMLAAVLSWLDPEAMAPLFHTPQGWAVMAVLAMLLTLGALAIRRLVQGGAL